MRASVVIPTRDRVASLARTLRALSGESGRGVDLEVVVVDDGSTMPLDEAVAPVARELPVTVLRQDPAGIGAARNRGAARAAGELLIFLDDDVEPRPGFVGAHLASHRGRSRAVALGALPLPEARLSEPFLYYLERVRHYDLCRRYGGAARIPIPPLNGNSSLRSAEFRASGGYDERFAGYGGEDTELGYRLRAAGVEFVHAPDAVGIHHHAKGFASYLADMRASGEMMVELVAKHPELERRSNLDVVARPLRRLPPAKLARRAALAALLRFPRLLSRLERVLLARERSGARRALYPLFYLVAHAHYARGMRRGLAGAAA